MAHDKLMGESSHLLVESHQEATGPDLPWRNQTYSPWVEGAKPDQVEDAKKDVLSKGLMSFQNFLKSPWTSHRTELCEPSPTLRPPALDSTIRVPSSWEDSTGVPNTHEFITLWLIWAWWTDPPVHSPLPPTMDKDSWRKRWEDKLPTNNTSLNQEEIKARTFAKFICKLVNGHLNQTIMTCGWGHYWQIRVLMFTVIYFYYCIYSAYFDLVNTYYLGVRANMSLHICFMSV
jgi:hypothetical protein